MEHNNDYGGGVGYSKGGRGLERIKKIETTESG